MATEVNNDNSQEIVVDNEQLQAQEAEYNEQVMIRRQKLADLQAQGKDPFDVYKVERTHEAQEIKDNYEELQLDSAIFMIDLVKCKYI